MIAASALGLLVSTTHIAIASLFGVGFFREHQYRSRVKKSLKQKKTLWGLQGRVTSDAHRLSVNAVFTPRKLVRRRVLVTIVAAWFVTVPFAGVLAGLLFFVFSAMGVS